jgi:hypothetical protein
VELAFWLPLVLIFASALVAAVVKRYTKDPALKIFHGSFVFLRLKDGRWVSGQLSVYSNCLELHYLKPEPLAGKFEKLSYVLYEHNLDSVDRILRPSPKEGSAERRDWEREIHRLRYPSALRRMRRKLRNGFNMLRDAFAQSITIIFGAVRRRTRLSTVPLDEGKVGEMGKTLISAVPNAYEPILEKYLGRQVVVETLRSERVYEQSGVLQEYSAKFLLVREVDLLIETPLQIPSDLFDDKFDVAFPRTVNLVRHLAQIASTIAPLKP